MSRVLVVSQPTILEQWMGVLGTTEHELVCVNNLADGLQSLADDQIDVVVSELNYDVGVPLLRGAHKNGRPIPAVLAGSEGCSVDSDIAETLGAVRVLQPPFSDSDLISAVSQAADCKHGFYGWVHGLSLVDLLQMYHYGRRSVTLAVGTAGKVHFAAGEIIHAVYDKHVGEAALREILLLKGGAIATSPQVEASPTISRSFQSLLLDMLREADESEREPQAADDAAVDDPFGFGDLLDSIPPHSIPPIASPVTTRSPTIPPMVNLLNAACAQLVSRVDWGVAAAVVDLQDEKVLGMHVLSHVGGWDNCFVDTVSALFKTSALSRLEEALGVSEPGQNRTDEFRAASPLSLQFAKRTGDGRTAIVLVTDRASNPGLCWAELRRSLPTFERALP